jgi:hypothetical protein
MIEITVTGDTYHIRKGLKDNGFRWNHINQAWHKIEDEESLDHTLDKITPFADRELTIRIRLQRMDKHGNPLSPVMRFILKDMVRPGVSALDVFKKEISVSCVSPIQSPDPINPKKEWKKLPPIDEGFF